MAPVRTLRRPTAARRTGAWYVRRAVRGQTRTARWCFAALGAAALAVPGCGGDEPRETREKAGTYPVRIVSATFPERQRLSSRTELEVAVRNAGDRAIPNVSLTIGNRGNAQFAAASQQSGLADPGRPVWIVDAGPRGGPTAYVNTWALGRLRPGRTKRFVFKVTAVKAGTHTVDYRVNAGLDGKAKAELPGGGAPKGSFRVTIDRAPDQACVTPDGEVVRNPSGSSTSCP